MPRLNSTKGAMQHDEAAIAPRMPPAATSFCVRPIAASSGAAGVRAGSQQELVRESFMSRGFLDLILIYATACSDYRIKEIFRAPDQSLAGRRHADRRELSRLS